MSAQENKLTKTIMESTLLVGIATCVGWVGKKMVKEPLISDPSSNIMNFGKWIVVLTGSIYFKRLSTGQKDNPKLNYSLKK